jgi:hypothetical protein
MTYDIPVKLLSFHLMLFSLFLLAPEARRLFNFFSPIAQPLLRGKRRYSAPCARTA